MESFFRSLDAAAHGLAAQSARLRVTSENLANADTPGYRRKVLAFREIRDDRGGRLVVPGPLRFGREPPARIHDPGHPLAGPDGFYEGSNVSALLEIADAREAQRSYEANLRLFDQARQMASGLLGLLRR